MSPCSFVFVQFYPLVQKYIRAILCTRAILYARANFTATNLKYGVGLNVHKDIFERVTFLHDSKKEITKIENRLRVIRIVKKIAFFIKIIILLEN